MKDMRSGFSKMICWMAVVILVFQMILPCSSYAAIEPTLTAKAAVVYCENTGEVVFTKNEDMKLQPYSVTKLITALVTVMNSPLDRTVEVSPAAASQSGSCVGLKAGEKVTVEELLYGALVQSGNDAAYALAESVSGSKDKFVKQMNRVAKNIGCTGTHFDSPAGLKSGNNYTTAEDLMMITKVVMDNETIREIAGTEKYMMKPTNKSGVRALKSGVFSIDDSVYAGKNGVWDGEATTALGCDVNGLNLYVVILGDTEEGRTADAKALIKYSDDKIEGVLAVKGGENVGSVRVRRGAETKVDVFTARDGYAYIPSEGSRSLISTEIAINDEVKAPLKSGDEVGTYKIKVGNELVNEVPLIVKKDVEVGWPTSYLGISNRLALIIGIAAAVILSVLVILLIIRIIVKIRRRIARKRKAMEIARKEMEDEEDRRKRGWDV